MSPRSGLLIVLGFTLWRVVTLVFDRTDLFVDEAQYWFWAQNLDLGYYSKPPMIAWVIRAMTALSGSDAIYWIRLSGPLIHMLRAGALPAKLTVIEERTVGADLGADAIKMGIYSGIVGFILVAVFIFVLYGTWGVLANIALLIHTILTFSALTLVGATLTLPGIAGIVLGIGLAVDANVLINERIREETRKGKGAFAAIDTGFNRAYSTIIDGNMTALIAAAILFFFGSGPVRGFAVTM